MSDFVYIVVEDSGDYEDRMWKIAGIFSDLDEAKACESADDDREIETWSVGEGSERQERIVHTATYTAKWGRFDTESEPTFETGFRVNDQDVSRDPYEWDHDGPRTVHRSALTREGAEQRLQEAVKDFVPVKPERVPVVMRYPYREYFVSPDWTFYMRAGS